MKYKIIQFLITSIAISIFLFGCSNKNETVETTTEETTKTMMQGVGIDSVMEQENLPVEIKELLELGASSENLFLGEVRQNYKFEILDNKLLFPEGNVILAVEDTVGRGREVISHKKDEILDIINIIENNELLSESEMKNPNAKLLGINLNLVLLTTDGNYFLVQIYVFDDNRQSISIMSEDGTEFSSLMIKSEELTGIIKSITNYQVIDLVQLKTFTNVTSINTKKQSEYTLTESEMKDLETIVRNANKETAMCSGPFDILVFVETEGSNIRMRWSNDSCFILAIEGMCYELTEEEGMWIDELIKEKI